MTLQQQYNLIKEGKGNKSQFLKNAKFEFPNLFNAYSSYEDAATMLKAKGLITEGVGGVVTGGRDQDWVKIFKQNISEEVRVEEKKTSKEVEDILANNFDYKDDKNIDNVYGQAFLHGFYTEMQDPKNEAKTVDEVKEIVRKNLASNRLHYTEDGMFGVKGVGYTTEAPGLGTPQEVKGPYKSSGMEPVKLREGISDFHKPQGFEKPELSDIDKMFTKEYKGKDEKGNGIYVIYKNDKEVKTIKGEEGNANAWINNEKRKLKEEAENQFLSDVDSTEEEEPMVPKNPPYEVIKKMLQKGLEDHVKNAKKSQDEQLREAIREIIQQELNEAKKKPSAGLTKKEKSAISKKAHAGKDIGKKGKGFEKVAKAAEKQYGSKEAGQKVAAAAMWKSEAKKHMNEGTKDIRTAIRALILQELQK